MSNKHEKSDDKSAVKSVNEPATTATVDPAALPSPNEPPGSDISSVSQEQKQEQHQQPAEHHEEKKKHK